MMSRLQRNLDTVSSMDVELYNELMGVRFDQNWIVQTETGLDVRIDGQSYYSPDAITYCREQLRHYLAAGGSRIFSGWPTRTNDRTSFVTRFWSDGWTILDEYTQVEKTVEDGACLIVFGVGCGLFLQSLLSAISVRHVFIVESDIRVLRCALEFIDLSALLSEVQGNNGDLLFIVGDPPYSVAHRLVMETRLRCNGWIDGSYVYEHTIDQRSKFIVDYLKSHLNEFYDPIGFFEDECTMMRQFLINTYRSQGRILKADMKPVGYEVPAFVIGSGPSLDNAFDLLKDLSSQAIIISCGTALGALLKHGIVPDFHVEIENSLVTGDVLTDLSQIYDLSLITLIASNTADPKAVGLFRECTYFFRELLTPTCLFSAPYGEIFFAGPTVSNAGVRIAILMGMKNIFLFGVDFGARNARNHHSKDSTYFVEKDAWERRAFSHDGSSLSLKREASFGGEVWTNQFLVSSAFSLSGLLSLYPGVTVINCSDGMRIDGTISTRLSEVPEVFQIRDDGELKQQILEKIFNEFEFVDAETLAPLYKIEMFYQAALNLGENIKSRFTSMARGDLDLSGLIVELDAVLRFPAFVEDQSQDERAATRTARSLFSGSVYMFYTFMYQSLRRLPDQDREHVQRQLLALADESLHQMIEKVNELVVELREIVSESNGP